MPTPLAPVIKGCVMPGRAVIKGIPHRLSRIVYGFCETEITAKRSQVGHSDAIGTGDERVTRSIGCIGEPHHSSRTVDP